MSIQTILRSNSTIIRACANGRNQVTTERKLQQQSGPGLPMNSNSGGILPRKPGKNWRRIQSLAN